MSQVVNICHGWMCPLVTRCGKSDFNAPPVSTGWTRHYQAPAIGEHCADFFPAREVKWGEGGDVER